MWTLGLAQNADSSIVAEEQDKAEDFQKQGAEPRRKRFLTDRPAGIQRANHPVHSKDDPRTFDEVTPNHAATPASCGYVPVAVPTVPW